MTYTKLTDLTGLTLPVISISRRRSGRSFFPCYLLRSKAALDSPIFLERMSSTLGRAWGMSSNMVWIRVLKLMMPYAVNHCKPLELQTSTKNSCKLDRMLDRLQVLCFDLFLCALFQDLPCKTRCNTYCSLRSVPVHIALYIFDSWIAITLGIEYVQCNKPKILEVVSLLTDHITSWGFYRCSRKWTIQYGNISFTTVQYFTNFSNLLLQAQAFCWLRSMKEYYLCCNHISLTLCL